METVTTTQRNIETICEIEKRALERRSLGARIGDLIAVQAGKMWFIAVHGLWFALWILLNTKTVLKIPVFDPFPFSLLTMIVSLESIFLSLFILMSQNRSSAQADQRNHLDLQVNLLAEHENTKLLQMVQALCAHHALPIANDREVVQLAQRTEPKQLLEDIQDNLPACT